ncbi:hypothetical protein ACN22W_36725 [Burkholderia theae]|uniref:hypothetical protein n=1 Tax=Burkholderia theae TaxID=3143496 RepID=UPI003AFB7DCC
MSRRDDYFELPPLPSGSGFENQQSIAANACRCPPRTAVTFNLKTASGSQFAQNVEERRMGITEQQEFGLHASNYLGSNSFQLDALSGDNVTSTASSTLNVADNFVASDAAVACVDPVERIDLQSNPSVEALIARVTSLYDEVVSRLRAVVEARRLRAVATVYEILRLCTTELANRAGFVRPCSIGGQVNAEFVLTKLKCKVKVFFASKPGKKGPSNQAHHPLDYYALACVGNHFTNSARVEVVMRTHRSDIAAYIGPLTCKYMACGP